MTEWCKDVVALFDGVYQLAKRTALSKTRTRTPHGRPPAMFARLHPFALLSARGGEVLRRLVKRGNGSPRRRKAPAGRHAWLATEAAAPDFRWPLSRVGTLVAAGLIGLLGFATLLMIYPVLSPQGPARVVYAFHDYLVLPLRGRIFERYEPVPHLVLLALGGVAVMFLIARRLGARIYLFAVTLWQRTAVGRTIMGYWLGWRRTDAPFWAALELDYRRKVDLWLQQPDQAERVRLVEAGMDLVGLPWVETDRRHDMARAAIGARIALLSCLAPTAVGDLPLPRLRKALSVGEGLYGNVLTRLLKVGPDPDAASEILEEACRLAEAATPPDDDLARDTVLWLAWFAAVVASDTALAEQIQTRIAATAFERDRKATGRTAQDVLYFNPALTSLSTRRGHRSALPGAAGPDYALAVLVDRIEATP